MSIMPWVTMPFLANWIMTIACTYVILTIWCFIVRPIYLSLIRKKQK